MTDASTTALLAELKPLVSKLAHCSLTELYSITFVRLKRRRPDIDDNTAHSAVRAVFFGIIAEAHELDHVVTAGDIHPRPRPAPPP